MEHNTSWKSVMAAQSVEYFPCQPHSLHDNPHKPGHRPPTQSEINVTLSYGGSDLYDVFP